MTAIPNMQTIPLDTTQFEREHQGPITDTMLKEEENKLARMQEQILNGVQQGVQQQMANFAQVIPVKLGNIDEILENYEVNLKELFREHGPTMVEKVYQVGKGFTESKNIPIVSESSIVIMLDELSSVFIEHNKFYEQLFPSLVQCLHKTTKQIMKLAFFNFQLSLFKDPSQLNELLIKAQPFLNDKVCHCVTNWLKDQFSVIDKLIQQHTEINMLHQEKLTKLTALLPEVNTIRLKLLFMMRTKLHQELSEKFSQFLQEFNTMYAQHVTELIESYRIIIAEYLRTLERDVRPRISIPTNCLQNIKTAMKKFNFEQDDIFNQILNLNDGVTTGLNILPAAQISNMLTQFFNINNLTPTECAPVIEAFGKLTQLYTKQDIILQRKEQQLKMKWSVNFIKIDTPFLDLEKIGTQQAQDLQIQWEAAGGNPQIMQLLNEFYLLGRVIIFFNAQRALVAICQQQNYTMMLTA